METVVKIEKITDISTPRKRWEVPAELVINSGEQNSEITKLIADGCGVSEVTARIIGSRGISSVEQARAFISPTLKEHLPDPVGMKNLESAAALILEFAAAKKRIIIYADFDVDGVSSCSQLLAFLEALGANVASYIPNRFVEGYGVAVEPVAELAKRGAELLVTLDCGINTVEPFVVAKRLGLKSIIIDHHQPGPVIPPADIIVDPAQEGCAFKEHHLATAGIVWLLLIVLKRLAPTYGFPAEKILDAKDFLDLAALGTICDMVPLVGLNRLIASRGVEALKRSTRPGVVALKEVSGVQTNKRFTAGHVSFGLGPRINAAGRLGDANEVVSMFTTDDSIRAKSIAERINEMNNSRRGIEEQVKETCIDIITTDIQLSEQAALAIYDKEFHIGVIGIAAQRLVERFYKPAAVMGTAVRYVGEKAEQIVRGSVRSVRGFNVAEVLHSLSDILLSGGGHAEAGGFTLTFENLEKFKEAFAREALKRLGSAQPKRIIKADALVKLNDIDFKLSEEFQALAPFGIGNPSPMLVAEDVSVDSVTLIGDKHLRLRLSQGNASRNAVAWDMHGHPLLRKGKHVKIAFQVEINTYQGISTVQLTVKDVF